MKSKSQQDWLANRALEAPTTRADRFLHICDGLHPNAQLIKDPDFEFLLGLSKWRIPFCTFN
jgi:hypothetical protein